MRKIKQVMAVVTLAAMSLAGGASAQTALKDVAYIRDGIVHVGMAYEISRKCDSLRARTFRGINFLQSLKNHARELGYSDADIDAYVNDEAEEDRLKGIARAKLAELGVVNGDEASYCAVGRAQIAANTPVGQLLR